jgi:hypothetical protein
MARPKSSIEATTIKTFRLKIRHRAFDNLMEEPTAKQSLQGHKGVFSRSKGKLFWHFKSRTCNAGASFLVENGGRNLVAGLTVPWSKAFVASATPNP